MTTHNAPNAGVWRHKIYITTKSVLALQQACPSVALPHDMALETLGGHALLEVERMEAMSDEEYWATYPPIFRRGDERKENGLYEAEDQSFYFLLDPRDVPCLTNVLVVGMVFADQSSPHSQPYLVNRVLPLWKIRSRLCQIDHPDVPQDVVANRYSYDPEKRAFLLPPDAYRRLLPPAPDHLDSAEFGMFRHLLDVQTGTFVVLWKQKGVCKWQFFTTLPQAIEFRQSLAPVHPPNTVRIFQNAL